MEKRTLYIGGSPCSGKSTAARILAEEYGAYYLEIDELLGELMHIAAAQKDSACNRFFHMTADEIWMRTPEEQCEEEFQIYREIGEMVLERADCIKEELVIAEGAALTPEVMEQINPEYYICVIPEAEFQISHYRQREWVSCILQDCTDKEKAFDNWMQRDILFAEQIKKECLQKNITCLVNDGTKTVENFCQIVKESLFL